LEADLSVALSNVTMEAKHVKVWLSKVQAELETPSSSGDDNTAAVLVASTLLRSATASTQNCEPRNHDDDSGVSTSQESRGKPWQYRPTAKTS
jgi:hypothetical protein